MLTLDQCIDLCGLNSEEVELLAEHASVPEIVAAQMACKMLQSREGVEQLECILHRRLAEARACGDNCMAQKAERASHHARRELPAISGPAPPRAG